MAANLQQMAAAGQLIPQQQQQGRPNQAQLSNLVYRNLMANTLAVQGWQTAVQISERMGKTLNLCVALNIFFILFLRVGRFLRRFCGGGVVFFVLWLLFTALTIVLLFRITNVMLAMPSAEWQRAASFGLEYEKDAFHNSPDKVRTPTPLFVFSHRLHF